MFKNITNRFKNSGSEFGTYIVQNIVRCTPPSWAGAATARLGTVMILKKKKEKSKKKELQL